MTIFQNHPQIIVTLQKTWKQNNKRTREEEEIKRLEGRDL